MRRRRRLRVISSNLTEADLLKIEKAGKRRADRPSTLSLREIHVADKVFQWRNRGDNIAESINHLNELVRVLKATKRPLDPIVVTPIGNRFFLLEGHHRLEAYHKVGWREQVPVRYFVGTVSEAQNEALMLNIKDKLRLSKAEKFDAAFRLLKQGTKKYEQIKDVTTVSLRTINTMAKVLREHPTMAAETSWRRAWSDYQRQLVPENDTGRNDDWREKKAQKLAKQMIKNVGVGFVRDTDITARALEIIDENLPKALIYEWLDTAEEVLVEVVGEENNEQAEQFLRAFIYGRQPGQGGPTGEEAEL